MKTTAWLYWNNKPIAEFTGEKEISLSIGYYDQIAGVKKKDTIFVFVRPAKDNRQTTVSIEAAKESILLIPMRKFDMNLDPHDVKDWLWNKKGLFAVFNDMLYSVLVSSTTEEGVFYHPLSSAHILDIYS